MTQITEMNKQIRTALKKEFPGVKFAIRNGNVSYYSGPKMADVEATIKRAVKFDVLVECETEMLENERMRRNTAFQVSKAEKSSY